MFLWAVPFNEIQSVWIAPLYADRVSTTAAWSGVGTGDCQAQRSPRGLAERLRIRDESRCAARLGTCDFDAPETSLLRNGRRVLQARVQVFNCEYAVALTSITDPEQIVLIHGPIGLNRGALKEPAIGQDEVPLALAAYQSRKHYLDQHNRQPAKPSP
jgi:hypothetical protein